MGKTFKSNRYAKATKELEAIAKGLSEKVSEDIKDTDKFHYHVALVKVTDRPGQVNNKVNVSVHCYSKQGWEKIQKNYAFHGFSKIVLVHDPSQVEEEQPIIVPQHVTTSATASVNEKADQKKQAEIDKAVAEAKKKWIEEQKAIADSEKENLDKAKNLEVNEDKVLTPEEEKELLSEDYANAMAGNKPELEAFLNKYGINHADLTNNEGRKSRITKWFEEQMKEDDEPEDDKNTDGDGTSGPGTDGGEE